MNTIQRIDIPEAAEFKTCEADHLVWESTKGWRVVGSFLQDVLEFDGYGADKRVVIERKNVRFFLLARDEKTALAELGKKLEEREAEWAKERNRASDAEAKLKAITKERDEALAKVPDGEATRERIRKMENDLATVREAIGSEKFNEIVKAAHEREEAVPF